MSNKHFVITIERQYGSGGRLTGKRLAEELGIHFYDEEILKMTSETSAIGEQYFRLADEKAGNNLLYRRGMGIISRPRRTCSVSSPPSSAVWLHLSHASLLGGAETMCCRIRWIT